MGRPNGSINVGWLSVLRRHRLEMDWLLVITRMQRTINGTRPAAGGASCDVAMATVVLAMSKIRVAWIGWFGGS